MAWIQAQQRPATRISACLSVGALHCRSKRKLLKKLAEWPLSFVFCSVWYFICQESCGFVFTRGFVFVLPVSTGQQVKAVSAVCLGAAFFRQLSFFPWVLIMHCFNQHLLNSKVKPVCLYYKLIQRWLVQIVLLIPWVCKMVVLWTLAHYLRGFFCSGCSSSLSRVTASRPCLVKLSLRELSF